MPRRTSLFQMIAVVAVGLVFAAPGALAQEDQLVKEVENSKFSTVGIVNSNAVFVRCGPGENYYPTTKLDKGAKIMVVGAKFDWLKIEPPQGSFCYVAKLYVDRHGDGKVGRVNKDSINVRAGSALSALKIGILCELRQNEEVTITGEEQEYFKILPPKGAYLYVNKKYVDPDPDSRPQQQVARTEPKNEAATGNKTEPATRPSAEKVDNTSEQPQPENVANNTNSAENPKNDGNNTTPENMTGNTPGATEAAKPTMDTPKPADPAAEAEAMFDKAEAMYLASRNQKLDDQPIETMLKEFEALSKNESLPDSMRRVCDARVAQLKPRGSAQQELLRLRKTRTDEEQRKLALKAEQEEIQKRIAENAVQVYTAVGTLQPSSLQVGAGATLYRVTDPATGRTLCYIRTNDNKVLALMNQFVGVKGAMQDEQRLGAKVILPTEVVPCDPAKVYVTVTAQIVPPSLTPKQPSHASTDPNQ